MNDFVAKKRLIVAGLAVLLLTDLVLFYFNGKMAVARENPEQMINAQTLQMKRLEGDIKRVNNIKTRLPEVQKLFDDFDGTLPAANKGYSSISQELGDIAKDTHILVEDIRFHQKELTERNLDEILVEATINGDYPSIVQFLNRLQRSKNTYIVDALNLEAASAGSGRPNSLKVSVHLRSYFRMA